ncbi:hypothetical protein CTAYLR_003819 [Chrysophaeum taylorii]|uniref:Ankyrin repeat-containing domain n=1 Tax=Chrysophaeum taylorii TaxID=2483200 RepID=A0AAD7XLZ2_9STRA|nr:hypothetical protein CTAYLR_003819 [Chrysophaeum taylorii]
MSMIIDGDEVEVAVEELDLKGRVLVRLIEMKALVLQNAVDEDEDALYEELVKEEWMEGLIEGVSEEALEGIARSRVEDQAILAEVSKLFDKVGVEHHALELLNLMVPGVEYDPRIDENVQLPRGVRHTTGDDEEELVEFLEVGAVDWIRWVIDKHAFFERRACAIASRLGKLEVLKFLRAENRYWDARTGYEAALGGHLEILEWLRANDFPRWDVQTCAEAALGGHLRVLEWLRRNGCPWDARTCVEAASAGHRDLLIWARENGCDWDERASAAAASAGNLDLLEWIHANGCPWNQETCTEAAHGGHLELLKWARSRGCPWHESVCASSKFYDVRVWVRPTPS